MYNLKMILNGETRETKTDNLKEAILSSLEEPFLFTEVYVTVEKGDFIRERRLSLRQGRRLFASEEFLDAFLVNLFL